MPNPDGAVDIYIQSTAPPGHESNWLPAPAGKFILWLRAYVPGAAILVSWFSFIYSWPRIVPPGLQRDRRCRP